jgi:hypothetical protein
MSEAAQIVENLLDGQEPTIDPKATAMQAADQEQAQQQAEKSSGVVNPNTVKQYGQIYHRTAKKSDGSACSAKVTSVKTWKRDPARWEIGWKYGMYQYGTVTPENASEWTTIEPPAVKPTRRR